MPAKIRTASTLVARFLERASTTGASVPNPFLPQKNPHTGRWHAPQYSLRRQKELVKQARADGVLGLLPPGPKARREDGAGVGLDPKSTAAAKALPVLQWEGEPAPRSTTGIRSAQRRFKGHKWEREQKERAEFVAKRMATMGERIAEMRAAKMQERTKTRPSLPF